MFYTTTSSLAVLVSVTKQSTNLPQIPQIHSFLALLHWSRGKAKQTSEIKRDRANTEEIFCRHHLFIHERNELYTRAALWSPFHVVSTGSRDPPVNPFLFVLKARKSWLVQKFLISYFFLLLFFSFHSSAHTLSTTLARSFSKTFCRLTLLHIFS